MRLFLKRSANFINSFLGKLKVDSMPPRWSKKNRKRKIDNMEVKRYDFYFSTKSKYCLVSVGRTFNGSGSFDGQKCSPLKQMNENTKIDVYCVAEFYSNPVYIVNIFCEKQISALKM